MRIEGRGKNASKEKKPMFTGYRGKENYEGQELNS